MKVKISFKKKVSDYLQWSFTKTTLFSPNTLFCLSYCNIYLSIVWSTVMYLDCVYTGVFCVNCMCLLHINYESWKVGSYNNTTIGWRYSVYIRTNNIIVDTCRINIYIIVAHQLGVELTRVFRYETPTVQGCNSILHKCKQTKNTI